MPPAREDNSKWSEDRGRGRGRGGRCAWLLEVCTDARHPRAYAQADWRQGAEPCKAGGGAGGGTRKMGEARTSQLVHVAILWALFPEVGAGALAPHAACARSRTSCRCQMGSSVPTSSVRGVEWC